MNHIADFLAQGNHSLFHGLTTEASTKKYRAYARRLHPDLAEESQKQQAHEAFTLLSKLWQEHTMLTSQTRVPHQTGTPVPTKAHRPAVLKTPRYTYYDLPCNKHVNMGAFTYFNATYGSDNYATVYLESNRYTASGSTPVLNAVHALETLQKAPETRAMQFAPRIIEHERTAAGTEVLTTSTVPQGFVSLAGYRNSRGLHAAEIKWVFRGLLAVLKKVHSLGLVNGAITPTHIFINPATTQVFLPYWASSVTEGTSLAFYATSDEAFYPEVATRGNRINHSLDLRMAASAILHNLSPDTPATLRLFFQHCITDTVIDADEMLREFDEACERASHLRGRIAATWARRKVNQ